MDKILLKNIKDKLPELMKLYEEISNKWCEEDYIYRFYHHSFKVYGLQIHTLEIYNLLLSLAPQHPLSKSSCISFNSMATAIVEEGTGHVFNMSHNKEWMKVTRPIVEAYYHMKYFLEMAIKYSSLEEAPTLLPSGWAALLHLYNIR